MNDGNGDLISGSKPHSLTEPVCPSSSKVGDNNRAIFVADKLQTGARLSVGLELRELRHRGRSVEPVLCPDYAAV